jgi:hypothetical protein
MAAKKAVVVEQQVSVVIEDNIAVPAITKGNAKYPFEAMKAGQSFFIPCDDASKIDALKINIMGMKRRVEKKNGGEFTVAKRSAAEEPKFKRAGVRVWKVRDALNVPVEAPAAPAPASTQPAGAPALDAFIPKQ